MVAASATERSGRPPLSAERGHPAEARGWVVSQHPLMLAIAVVDLLAALLLLLAAATATRVVLCWQPSHASRQQLALEAKAETASIMARWSLCLLLLAGGALLAGQIDDEAVGLLARGHEGGGHENRDEQQQERQRAGDQLPANAHGLGLRGPSGPAAIKGSGRSLPWRCPGRGLPS